jgi:hypothetical protein
MQNDGKWNVHIPEEVNVVRVRNVIYNEFTRLKRLSMMTLVTLVVPKVRGIQALHMRRGLPMHAIHSHGSRLRRTGRREREQHGTQRADPERPLQYTADHHKIFQLGWMKFGAKIGNISRPHPDCVNFGFGLLNN